MLLRKRTNAVMAMFLQLSLLFETGSTYFTGTITPSDDMIQKTDTTYNFNLSYQDAIVADTSKIVIRFPYDFQEQFEVTECVAISGFNPDSLLADNKLVCEYEKAVKILTILLDRAPGSSITRLINFTVAGVTNPAAAVITGMFNINALALQADGQWLATETDGGNLATSFTPGALSSNTMSLSQGSVGAYSDLTVNFETMHAIPTTNGQIEIEFPKWNPNAPADQFQSYVDTQNSITTQECEKVTGFPVEVSLDCVFSTGTIKDKLTVILSSPTNINVPVGVIQFLVKGIRGPPTTKAVDGFVFNTAILNSEGGINVIDQSPASAAITLKVDNAKSEESATVLISADTASIGKESTLTFKILTVNPIDKFANIQLTFPSQIGVTNIDTVTVRTLFSQKQVFEFCSPTSPDNCVEWLVDERKLTIKRFVNEFTGANTNIYIEVGKVGNPSQAGPSDSFTYLISDMDNNPIELVNEGVYFVATAGGFQEIQITTDKKTINERNVLYTFRMAPENTFDSTAIIQITLPAQLFVENPEVKIGATEALLQTVISSQVDVRFNRIITISSQYSIATNEQLYISVSGFTNPPTTQETDAFEIQIYNQIGLDQIVIVQSDNQNSALRFTADPSFNLSMQAEMSEKKTGQIQTKFVITGTMTQADQSIVKQAQLRVFIPPTFLVSNLRRTAATCTVLTGFSDEITCAFDETTRGQLYLIVTDGFDSQDFTGTSFSFSIAEIQNPFDSQASESFQMQILDKNGGTMYSSELETVTLEAEPSNFAFVYVESNSPTNADAQSRYIVSITLGVDTPNDSWLVFNPPSQVTFLEGGEIAMGTQNLKASLEQKTNADGGRDIKLTSLDGQAHPSGATIQLEIGYLKNAMSLKTTDPFYLATYVELLDGPTPITYKINESKDQVRVTNSVSGPITISEIKHFETEQLGDATQLKFSFDTTSPIPLSASMTFTIFAALEVADDAVIMMNGKILPDRVINTEAKQFKIATMPLDLQTNFVIEIVSGLKNPTTGPYALNYAQLEFSDVDGFSIDKITREDTYKTINCLANCGTCEGTLSTCTGCSIGFFLKGTECLADCGKGFYGESGKQVCTQCSSSCLECTVTPDSCTVCNPAVVPETPYADPSTLKCYKECPQGTYLDVASTQCLRCSSPCYTCSGKDTCTSCDRTDQANEDIFFLKSEGKCYETCPNISVPTPSKQCEECESPCETCENLTKNCLTCIKGTYLHKNNECVTDCPFLYLEDDTERICLYFGEISLPVPFTIVAFVLSVGAGISAFVKGADKDGREQKGTAFFVTMLALIDMLLRVNWIVLAYSAYIKDFMTTFGLLIGVIVVSFSINVFLWRRYFYSIYRYEETDPLFSAYVMKYPATANILIFLSYLLSFQAIRLTYSRILGKKKFMARFSRRLRYFRLIGRLSVFEILLIYIPAVSTNIYSLTVITEQKDSLYWLNVDSLILILYAIILITVVLTQREQLMNYTSYFKFSELFTFTDDNEFDDEISQDNIAEQLKAPVNAKEMPEESEDLDQMEVHSAHGAEDILKMKMYQIEQRYRSLDDARGIAHQWNKSQMTDGRVVSVIDYQEYRKLEDKRDRIMLKKTLYERKKVSDESQVVLLNEELNKYQRRKDDLNGLIPSLKKQLRALQKKIVTVDKTRKKELYNVEQEKRRDIIRRAGREVPYQSHSGIRSKAQSIAANGGGKPPKDVAGGKGSYGGPPAKESISGQPSQQNQPKRKQRGGQRGQQVKASSPDPAGNKATHGTATDGEQQEDQVVQHSPTMFAAENQIQLVTDRSQEFAEAADDGQEFNNDPALQSFGAQAAQVASPISTQRTEEDVRAQSPIRRERE